MRLRRAAPFPLALLASTALTAPGQAQGPGAALPQGGRFVAGQGAIGAPTANALAVTQHSARGVIDWRSFNIGQGATVTFNNGAGATLNRVTGGDLTQILGTLRATGTLFVVNPQGVVVGQTGVVATGGSFVASTLGIANDAFMRGGTLVFRADGSGANAEVRNLGQIMAGAGDVVLIARSVTNAGTIQAPRGTAALAAGSEVLLREGPDGARGMVRVRGASGDVTNAGLIEATQAELRAAGGNVYALAGNNGGAVRATGTEVREGRVWLSARGGDVQVSGEVSARNADGAGGAVSVRAGGEAAVAGAVSASGTAGGQVRVRAERVRVEGQVSADGANGAGGRVRVRATQSASVAGAVTARGAAAGGTVEVDAGASGRLDVAGRVDVSSSAGSGGRAVLLGSEIALRGAVVDASGDSGGGVVRVGGGREGGEGLREAARVSADADTAFRADATGARGSGGDVVLWSTARTDFHGLITARGGAQGGDGGEAEVSSRGRLVYQGTTNLLAPAGRTGTLLLDPYNIFITDGTQTADGGFVPGSDDSVINVATLQTALATANVTVSTGLGGSAGTQAGNITVAAPITWASNTRLTLTAANAIAVNAPITITGGGQLALNYNTSSVLNLSFSATATLGGTGRVEFQSNANQASQALTINGQGYTLLRSMDDVAGMSGTGRSALAAPLTSTTTYADAVVAASQGSNTFTGTFTGLGNTISGLTIDAAGISSYGLFGSANGTIRDIGLRGGSVRGGSTTNGEVYVGGLVGFNRGTLAFSFVTGEVSGGANASVGGLAGLSWGAVWSSFTTGPVSGIGRSPVGGLVGNNGGNIRFSFSTAPASSGAISWVGGLAGINTGIVASSFSMGAVTGGSDAYVGGLVGFNGPGTVLSSFSTGAVSSAGSPVVGGLIGSNFGGTVTNSFWDTQTSGRSTSAGGVGRTTQELQGGFDLTGLNTANGGAFAGGSGGLYPYLVRFFPNGIQAVSGTAYSDEGVTALAGATVGVAAGGASLLPATTGANGYFYAFGSAGTLPASSPFVAWTGTSSATLASTGGAPATLITGVDLWGNTLRVPTASLTWSGAFGGNTPHQAALAAASVPGAQAAVNGTGGVRLEATGDSFTLDTALTSSAPLTVTTRAGAGLTVAAAITAQGTSLRLRSGGTLAVNAPVTLRGAGSVALAYDASSALNLSFAGAAAVGGTGSLRFLAADGSAQTTAPTGGAAQSLTINGDAFTLLYNMADVAGMSGTGRSALAAPLDAAGTTYADAVVTASQGASSFTGTFTGLGNTVSNLTIRNSVSGARLGLFGTVGAGGTLRDIGLTGGSVTGGNSSWIGGLVGHNAGTVTNAFTTGAVTGGSAAVAGGLVGWNSGTVIGGFSTSTVSGSLGAWVGGLVGGNFQTVSTSFATGVVSGSNNADVGGLAGRNAGTVTTAFAMGAVFGGGGASAGGLVGRNFGTVTSAFATGAVLTVGAASSTGGLVGVSAGGTVTASFWDTQSTGLGTSAGGTGLTTAQMQGLVNAGVAGQDPLAAGGLGVGFTRPLAGLYPYLDRFFPNGVQVVTGMVAGGAGATPAAGVTVGIAQGDSIWATASTGRNGVYYAFGAAGTLQASTGFVAWANTNTATQGATGTAPATLTAGVNLYANTLAVPTSATLLSGAPTLAEMRAQALAMTSVAAARTAINGALGRGLLTTGGSFTLDVPVTSAAPLVVTTQAGAALTVAAPVTMTGASLGLLSGGTLEVNAPVVLRGAGSIALAYDASDLLNLSFARRSAGGVRFLDASGAAQAASPGNQALSINGQGFTLLYNMADVAGMSGTGRSALAAPLDAAGTTYADAVVTASQAPGGFTGTFTGLGNTISGLTIASTATNAALGLFGRMNGVVRDIGLLGGSVTGGASATLGGVAARSNGIIAFAFNTGAVSSGGNGIVGGLVGSNSGILTSSFGTGPVSSFDASVVGGLVGFNTGTVQSSFSTGAVSSTATGVVGGLVGRNFATVTSSFSTGAVSGALRIGGLVGEDLGSVSNSFWDTQSSGIATSAGGAGAVGLTTRQFQGLDAMPGGASLLGTLNAAIPDAFAGGSGGLYPYLARFFPNGVQAVTGTVFADAAGTTPLASGAAGPVQVTVVSGSSTFATATAGANGVFYTFGAAGSLPANAGIAAFTVADATTGATNSGLAFASDGAAVRGGVDLLGDVFVTRTAATTLSASPGTAEAAANAALAGVVADAGARRILASGASFTLDQAITRAGTLLVDAGGAALIVGAGLSAAAGITLTNASGITIAAAGSVSGASPVIASSGTFTNNAGATAVTATSGRWLVYAASPVGNVFGGLDSGNSAVWNTAAGAAVGATGNRYVFANQPTLTVTTTDLAKTYGDNATAGVAAAYTITGFSPGVAGAFAADTPATAVTGAPEVTSTGAAATASVAGGPYAVTAALGTLTSPAGYAFAFSDAGRLTVNRATLTYVADAASRTYGEANPTLTGRVTGFVNGETLAGATTGTLSFGTPATATSNAGSYRIDGSGLSAANYSFVQAAGNETALIVARRLLTIAGQRAYDGTTSFVTGALTVTGGVAGETLTLVAGSGTAASANAGTYAGSPVTGLALSVSGGNALASNYALPETGTLTIARRGLTVTADPLTRAYGDANPTLTYVVGGAGLVGADTLTGALATSATATSGVGPYAITQGTLAASANYAVTYVGANLTVTPRPITVTADAVSRVYGDTNPTLTYVVGGSGLVNGDALTGALATPATAASGVGPYAITQGTLAAGANYAVTYVGANLAVTQRPITVTADAQTRVYGDANPTFTFGVGGRGLVNGDTLTGALATTATVSSGVGPHAITQGTLAASTNYALTFTGANLVVTARPITVTADALSRVYGDTNPTFTYVVGGRGLANGDTLTGALATAATAASGVGLYGITQGTLAASANYALTYVGANLTVTQRPITVTADVLSRAYGDANPTLTYVVGGRGLANGDTLTGALATAATVTSSVGPYAITQGTLAAPPDYTLTYTGANLTVTARPIIVTAHAQTRVYGDANPTLTYAVGGAGLVNGDALAGAPTTAATVLSGVGLYGITQGTLAAPGNYALTFVPGTLAVTARPLTVTAASQTRLYGDPNPVLTYTLGGGGLVGADTLTGALATGATPASGVGNHPITQGTLAASSNYALSFVPGTLGVTPRPLTVAANAQTRLYGDPNPTLTYTIPGGGLVNGDTLSGALATTAAANAGIGNYPITQGTLAASANYALSFTPATLSVTPALLVIRPADVSRLYGQANPALAATVQGLVNGDTAAVVQNLSVTTAAGAASGAGSYPITASGAAAANYTVTYQPGTLTVAPAPLIVMANAASRLYGQANPAFSATAQGLVNGDTLAGLGGALAFVTAATSASNVGAYPITPSGVSSANYSITFLPGTLTVNPAPLTVTVNDASRGYGQANPAFGISVIGFVNNDTAAVLRGAVQFATAATTGSPVGPWLVTASGLNAVNYVLGYRPGTLTILPATLTLRANSASRLTGQPNPAFGFTLSGLAAGDTAAVVQGVVLSSPADAASPPGFYPILVTGGTAANYDLIRLPGTLTVQPSRPGASTSQEFQGSNVPPPGVIGLDLGRAQPLGGFGAPLGPPAPPAGSLGFGSFFEAPQAGAD